MKFARYLAVQVVAYGIDMGGFLLFLEYLGIGPISANVFGKIAAGIFAFFAHRSFTFGLAPEEKEGGQIVKYFVLLALNLPLSSAVLSAAMLLVSHPVVAKCIADVILVVATYWLSKKYVFSGSEKVNAHLVFREGRDT